METAAAEVYLGVSFNSHFREKSDIGILVDPTVLFDSLTCIVVTLKRIYDSGLLQQLHVDVSYNNSDLASRSWKSCWCTIKDFPDLFSNSTSTISYQSLLVIFSAYKL